MCFFYSESRRNVGIDGIRSPEDMESVDKVETNSKCGLLH